MVRIDEFGYYNRYWILYGLMALIATCLIGAAICFPSILVNSAGLISDLTGIVQLEVSGVFEGMLSAGIEREQETGKIPSRWAREIIDIPGEDFTVKLRFEEWLKRSPKAGVYFIALGCFLQLAATWMP